MNKIEFIEQPQPLAMLAFEKLRDAIFTGVLKRGSLYTENKLASDLGISRTPVREALLALSERGLVRFLPRKGVMVTDFTEHDVREIFQLREIMETASVGYVARFYEDLDLTEVEKAFTGQRTAAAEGHILSWLEFDRAFHTAIAALTHNRRLVKILQDLHLIVQMISYPTFQVNGRIDEDLMEHGEIYEAVRNGRPDEAIEAMKNHLNQAMALVLSIARLTLKDRVSTTEFD
jgi:DNA-binding GntR family transcriptional regulator